jgi:hypothetical protein
LARPAKQLGHFDLGKAAIAERLYFDWELGSVIRALLHPTTGTLNLAASVGGTAVYLDNFAISSLATGDATLRKRFVAVINEGADLIFFLAHAIELPNSVTVKAFLDELGDHWYPIEMVIQKVLDREDAGHPPDQCCFDEDLLKAYFANSTCDYVPGSKKVIDLSAGAFRLGAFIDWLEPRRQHHLGSCRALDDVLNDGIGRLRAKAKRQPMWLDAVFPQFPFNHSRRVRFAYVNLFRALILDRGYQLKKGDGVDFGHAVMASALASYATLDKEWKRRVENLPKPNVVPRIFYEPEIPEMITAIETQVAHIGNLGKGYLEPKDGNNSGTIQ